LGKAKESEKKEDDNDSQ